MPKTKNPPTNGVTRPHRRLMAEVRQHFRTCTEDERGEVLIEMGRLMAHLTDPAHGLYALINAMLVAGAKGVE